MNDCAFYRDILGTFEFYNLENFVVQITKLEDPGFRNNLTLKFNSLSDFCVCSSLLLDWLARTPGVWYIFRWLLCCEPIYPLVVGCISYNWWLLITMVKLPKNTWQKSYRPWWAYFSSSLFHNMESETRVETDLGYMNVRSCAFA